jgi:hypothetical protein
MHSARAPAQLSHLQVLTDDAPQSWQQQYPLLAQIEVAKPRRMANKKKFRKAAAKKKPVVVVEPKAQVTCCECGDGSCKIGPFITRDA